MNRSAARSVLALTAALLAIPPLIDIATGGMRRVASYLAADAFYYLTVARNIVELGFPTFDHERATNGFHPAWQFLLAGMYGLAHAVGVSDASFLFVVVVTCIALVTCAVVLMGHTFERAYRSLPAFYVLLPIGALGLMLVPLWAHAGDEIAQMNPFEGSAPLWGTLWIAINGMETPLLLAAYALMTWIYVTKPVLSDARWGAALGLAMALVVLSRLDHAPFAVLAGIPLMRAARVAPHRAFAALLVAAAIPLLAYLASNVVYFGGLVPVSGSLKSTAPHPTPVNAQNVAELLAASPPGDWLERAGRAIASVAPAIGGCIVLAKLPTLRPAWVARDPGARFDAILWSAAWASIVLGVYDFAFVPWAYQGHWYYPLPALFLSLAALRAIARSRHAELFSSSRIVAPAIACGCALVGLVCFVEFHRHLDHHAHYADYLIDEAPHVRAIAEHDPSARIVEFDDGVCAWGSGLPSIPASGLTLDPDGARRVHRGGLLPLAVERHHLYFMSSIVSMHSIFGTVQQSWPQGRASFAYTSDHGFFGVVRLDP
jgi:hypothetical protein